MPPIYVFFAAGILFLIYAVFLYSSHENNDYSRLINRMAEEKAFVKDLLDNDAKEIGDLRAKLSDLDAMNTMLVSDIKKLKTDVEEIRAKMLVKKTSELKLKFDSPVQFEVVRRPQPATVAKPMGKGKSALLDRAGIVRSRANN